MSKTGAPGLVLRGFEALVGIMNSIGTIGIVLLMILICGDVFMRAVASRPIAGVPELVRVVIVIVIFLQVAHTLAVGRFTVSEVFLDMIQVRSPKAVHVLKGIYALLGAALFACVAYGCYGQFERSWESSDFIGAQGIFTVPLWPMKAVAAFGSAVLTIQFLVNAVKHFRGETIGFDEVANEVNLNTEGPK